MVVGGFISFVTEYNGVRAHFPGINTRALNWFIGWLAGLEEEEEDKD